jgi:SAM-dependent methyltransferase
MTNMTGQSYGTYQPQSKEVAMSLTIREILQVRAHDTASQTLGELIEGAEAVALLSGAVESGIIGALYDASSPQQIAMSTGLEQEQIDGVLRALEAYGLVKQRNGIYNLAPHLKLLTSADAPNPLINTLRVTNIRMRNLANLGNAGKDYTAPQAYEVLSIAQGIISALSFARGFVGVALGNIMPEVKGLWQAGACHLESGCGVGNNLFQILTSYHKVTAVGVEIDAETANEARRRAVLFGVTDRVEVRQMDACTLTDEAVFDTAQWSQFFFPNSYRVAALRALFKALKPGGYVFMPLLLAVSGNIWAYRRDMLRMALRVLKSEPLISLVYLNAFLLTSPAHQRAEKRLSSLQELVYRAWGIPAKTAKELQIELEDSGFRVLRTIPTPASRLFPNRGFLLAQRT